MNSLQNNKQPVPGLPENQPYLPVVEVLGASQCPYTPDSPGAILGPVLPILRPYQEDLIEKVTDVAIEGHRRILIQLVTGGGKTVVAAHIIRHAIENGKKALILTHRREILFQTEETLRRLGIDASVMIAGDPYDPTRDAIVASVLTFHSWVMRRGREAMPGADIVVVDEAHRLPGSKVWQSIISAYPDAYVLGLTATPMSKSGQGLGHHFDTMVLGPTYNQAITDSWLVPIKYYVPSVVDLRGVKTQGGDYVQKDLEARVDRAPLIGDILKNWLAKARDRQTIIFTAGIKHSIHVAATFNAADIPTMHIDGETDSIKRKQILEDFATQKIRVITNCQVLGEGWDCPSASCLILARPTKSLTLYLQTAGRVLRPAEGKQDCLLFDHSGVVYEHGLVTQDWDWKLEYHENDLIERKRQWKQKVAKYITCKKCKYLYSGRLDCPECHTVPERHGKPYPTYEAFLEELTSGEKLQEKFHDKKTWYLGLRAIVRKKEKNLGWAAHLYREKFGTWPAGIWKRAEDIEPPPEVSAWFKKRLDAWIWKQRQTERPIGG